MSRVKLDPKLKVAIVCDWLDSVGGAEQVIKETHALFPKAPIFTSIYRPKSVDWFKDADVRTGWLNLFPVATRKLIPFLRTIYFGNLNLTDYDLVISITGAEAKGIKTRKDALHISYVHAPTQYYWEKYQDYLDNPGFGILDPLVRKVLSSNIDRLRAVDLEFSRRPDFIVVPSNYIKSEVKKYYGRKAEVIFPPVDVSKFKNSRSSRRKGFVVTSRQVSWKKLDVAIEACIKLDEPLVLVGDGTEHRRLVRLAKGRSDLIKFTPTTNTAGVKRALRNAKGYIFPSLEPFGIAPIEALAAGTPVIAYGRGGALDYIKDGKNGVLFKKQDVDSLVQAIERFNVINFNRAQVTKSAEKFSREIFKEEFMKFINKKLLGTASK